MASKLFVPVALFLLATSVSCQYGRSAPRSSSFAGYGSSGLNGAATSPLAGSAVSQKNKPSGTGGYGGSYGGIYDNPSSTIEEIEPLDEELENVEQPAQPLTSGPAPVRAGYGTFRPQSAAPQGFNSGVRYAPELSSPLSARTRPAGGVTARPRVGDELGEEFPLEESSVDEFEGGAEVSPSRPSAFGAPRSYGVSKPKSSNGGLSAPRSYGPSTQFGVQGGAAQTLGKRRQNAAVYGGSVPQIFGSSQDNSAPVDESELFGEDNAANGIATGGVQLQNIANNQYGAARSNGKKRIGAASASSSGATRSFGGSVPSYASQGLRSSGAALGGSNAQGPVTVNAAIQSTHRVEFRDVPSESAPVEPITIEVQPNQNELQFRFKSASTKLNIENEHEPSQGSFSETESEDEPHVLKHTVTRPIYQEVREVITPFRKITQEVQPVQEEISTIVAKETAGSQRSTAGDADLAAGTGGQEASNGQALSSGAQRSSGGGGYGSARASGLSAGSGAGFSSRPSTAGSYGPGPSSGAFAFSTQAPSNGLGFGLGQNLKPTSTLPKSKPKLNGVGNGQAVMSMSFNYGPASTSYSSETGLSTGNGIAPKAPKANGNGYGSSSGFGNGNGYGGSNGNGKPKSQALTSQNRGGYGTQFTDDSQSSGAINGNGYANGNNNGNSYGGSNGNGKPKSQTLTSQNRGGYGAQFSDDSQSSGATSGSGYSNGNNNGNGYGGSNGNGKPKSQKLTSQNRGGYGTQFTDDSQSAGAIQVDRVGNGVAYKMMTFTMGADAMKKQGLSTGAQSSGPSSSTRSGYGSSRPSAGYSGLSSGASNANFFSASTVPSLQRPGQKRRAVPSARPVANAALLEDELDNGEIDVDLFEEEPVSLATGGVPFFASTPSSFVGKPKSANGAAAAYRNKLGRTRTSYRSA